MLIEIIKFFIYALLIVLIVKYVLIKLIRKLAESLNLSSNVIGNIEGIATSIPELLTVCLSNSTGLANVSVYNIISSNTINFVQYMFTIFISKNYKTKINKAIKIDLVLALSTIIFPIILIILEVDFTPSIVPIFILLFILSFYINYNAHKLYLKKEETIIENTERKRGKMIIIIKYAVFILMTCIVLYVVGDLLSNSLKRLAIIFNILPAVLGIILGFITSLPELITFLEAQKYYKKNEYKKEEGIVEATNNLLTSNSLNLFVIQSFGIIIFYVSGIN